MPPLMAWFLLLMLLLFIVPLFLCFLFFEFLFVCFLFVLFCLFFLVAVGLLLFVFYLFIYLFIFLFIFIGDGVGTKDWVFRGGRGKRKHKLERAQRFGEAGHWFSAGKGNWEGFWFGWRVGKCEVATYWCGKTKWVVIGIKLC